MSDKRTCHVCGKTFDGYGLRLWCSVGCESNYFEIASLESRLQAMTERAEKAEAEVRRMKEEHVLWDIRQKYHHVWDCAPLNPCPGCHKRSVELDGLGMPRCFVCLPYGAC